jgi:protocatechuate 3,4-dioxygenase beta subunit
MKISSILLFACLCLVGLRTTSFGQASEDETKPQTATLSGTIIKDPGGEPVKKVVVELIADEHDRGGNYTGVSGVDGAFRIVGIRPGQYRLFVEKSGYLEMEKNRPRQDGRLLALVAGQDMKGMVVHLQAAAIVHGRVTDEDGDPMAGAQVSVLHQTYQMGRRRWEVAGAETTNDLGEYRLGGIVPGSYCVSVSPPPSFRAMIEASGAGTHRSSDKPQLSYRTTYYPAALDPDQASPVQFHAGDEFPIDFSLVPQPSFALRGSVIGIPPNSQVVVMLQSRDMGQVFNGTETHKDGSFEIQDVAPGDYLLMASVAGGSDHLMARQRVHVVASAVEGLRVSLQSGSIVRGHVSLESAPGKSALASQFSVLLVAGDGDGDATGVVTIGTGFSPVAQVQADGSFEWKDVAPGHYYPQLISGPGAGADWFLRGASSFGRDISESGFTVSGSTLVMDLVASARGATATGLTKDHEGKPVANATVVAVPAARYRKRLDRYATASSDQAGHFTLQGLRPGDYTLLAWDSLDGEQYLDPDFLKRSEGQGTALKAIENERKIVELEVIPATQDQ